MRAALCIALGLAVALTSLTSLVSAADDKEVTLKGKITCAKCDLGKEDKCAVVIVVKDGDKDKIYYFDKKGHDANHTKGANVCKKAKNGTVTGVVSKDGDKNIITVKKVEVDK